MLFALTLNIAANSKFCLSCTVNGCRYGPHCVKHSVFVCLFVFNPSSQFPIAICAPVYPSAAVDVCIQVCCLQHFKNMFTSVLYLEMLKLQVYEL